MPVIATDGVYAEIAGAIFEPLVYEPSNGAIVTGFILSTAGAICRDCLLRTDVGAHSA